jgi:hypothetical protein
MFFRGNIFVVTIYRVEKFNTWLGNKLFWKWTLTLFFSQYPPLFLASIINMNEVKIEN